MRRTILAGSLCLTLGLLLSGCSDDNANDPNKLSASLAGANETPPNQSAGTGTASFTVNGTSVQFSLDVSGLTGVTAAHIHSGAAGTAGPVRVTLFSGPQTGAVTGMLVQGSFSTNNVTGITFDQLLTEMRSGAAYVNVHTLTFPAGEIRGQLKIQ